jgi:hypothetical protein
LFLCAIIATCCCSNMYLYPHVNIFVEEHVRCVGCYCCPLPLCVTEAPLYGTLWLRTSFFQRMNLIFAFSGINFPSSSLSYDAAGIRYAEAQCGHAAPTSSSWCLLFNELKLLLTVILTTSATLKGPFLSTVTPFFVQVERALEIYFTFVSSLAGFLLGWLFDLKIEALHSFETLVDFYRTTRS